MIEVANRIADLLADVSTTPQARQTTPSNACRGNTKSRGPKAPRKTKAGRKATRHGLLAGYIAPPDDGRRTGVLFRQLRRQLRLDFKPTTLCAAALLDALAFDLVQLARAKRMLESVFVTPPLEPYQLQQWRTLQQCKADRELLSEALAANAAEELWEMSPAKARRLAAMLVDCLRHVEEDLRADQDPEVEPLTPEDKVLREPQDRMLAVVGKSRRALAKVDLVAAVFIGRMVLRPANRKRLVALLTYASEIRKRWIDDHPELEKTARRMDDAALAKLAQDPGKLLLLQRYETRLEKAIERKLRILSRYS